MYARMPDLARGLFTMRRHRSRTRVAGGQRHRGRPATGHGATSARRSTTQGYLRAGLSRSEEATDILTVITSFQAFDELFRGSGLPADVVADRLIAMTERSILPRRTSPSRVRQPGPAPAPRARPSRSASALTAAQAASRSPSLSVQLQDRQAAARGQLAKDRLLLEEDVEIVVLRGVAADLEPLGPGGLERLRSRGAQDDVEADRRESLLEPAEVLVATPRWSRCQASVERWKRSTTHE